MFWDILLCIGKYIPGVQEACSKDVRRDPRSLEFIPISLMTQEMCSEAFEVDPYMLEFVPVHLRMGEMCKRAVEEYLHPMRDVPDHLKHKKCAIKRSGKTHGS